MKKQLLTIVFFCVTGVSLSQINEIGLFIGGTNYIGDVGKTTYISPNKFSGAFIYKYNLNPRIALRGTFSYLPIEADDANSSNGARKNRGFKFKNTIQEVAIGIEYNFFDYNLSSTRNTFTPYILVELAGFSYDEPKAKIGANAYSYQSTKSFAIPFGLGIKTKLTNRFAAALETKVRYTFTDTLDHTSSKIASLNFGGNSNDWYVFTGISIVYTFGRPTCYSQFN